LHNKEQRRVFHKKGLTGGIFFDPGMGNAGNLPIEQLAAPPVAVIPLVQHRGSPAQPVVKVGDHVAIGQIIGAAIDATAVPVHASISGTVTKLARYPYAQDPSVVAVTIENNGKEEFASPIPYDKPWTESTPDELVKKIALSGIVDRMSGGLPVHAALAAACRSSVGTLIINALETEPYCSADTRLCVERIEKVATGAAICKKITGVAACLVAVSEKSAPLMQAVATLLSDARLKEISLVKVKKAKYPRHEKQFVVRACTGAELPFDASETTAGCVVVGVAAAAAVYDAIVELVPSYQRVVTVAGGAIAAPKNLLVRIGTPVGQLLGACGADFAKIKKLVSGGPLSGAAVHDFAAPVTKSTAALLAIEETFPGEQRHECIGCRRCSAVCPMRLAPSRLVKLANKEDAVGLGEWNVGVCIECGCCAYVCPAKINLVHGITFGKLLRQKVDV
jgi:Na+-translocating ferredoxin:NAD+ oxidoreductase subunit C